jgi:hypothetical protein
MIARNPQLQPSSIRRGEAAQGSEQSREGTTETMLAELLREEDQKQGTIDPGETLRRRPCPPGE